MNSGRQLRRTGSERQMHFAEQGVEAGIVPQVLQEGIRFHFSETGIMLSNSPVEPLKGLIDFATESIHVGHLIGRVLAAYRNQLSKARIRFLVLPQSMVRERESTETKDGVLLLQHLGQ